MTISASLLLDTETFMKGRFVIKATFFKQQPLKKVLNAIPQQYAEQIKPSSEIVSAIYYTKDKFVVTSAQAIKGMKRIGDTEDKKIAIAYDFSEEAASILKQNGYYLVQYSNFTWSDDTWLNRGL